MASFTVKSPHEKNSSTAFRQLWKDRQFTDVTLVTEDGANIPSHKLILATSSKFFQRILANQSDQNVTIHLQGIMQSELKLLLQFIYLGQCQIDDDGMDSFLEIGTFLKIQSILALTGQPNENEGATSWSGDFVQNIEDIVIIQCDLGYEEKNGTELSKIALPLLVKEYPNKENIFEEPAAESKKVESDLESEKVQKAYKTINESPNKIEVIDEQVTKLNITKYETDGQIGNEIDINTKSEQVNETLTKPEANRKYDCDDCSYKARRADKLRYHKLNKHKGVRFNCDKCGYEAKRPDQLASHIAFKHEGISHACTQCDYKAAVESRLKRHMIAHDENESLLRKLEKKEQSLIYECDECDKKFNQQSKLVNHIMYRHQGVTVPCNECDFKASSMEKLKRHTTTIHEGVSYPCNQCSFQSSRKESLKNHTKNVHEKQKYFCDACPKVCRTPKSLQNHKILKHKINCDIKPKIPKSNGFNCTKCDYHAQKRIHIKLHVEYKHSNK